YVSGRLGDAALALAHHRGRVTLAADELARCDASLLRPAPRVTLGERLRGVATAAIDVSDGLVGDLGHLLGASRVGATVEMSRIPRCRAVDERVAVSERALALGCLLAGGDDYELCFTAPERAEGGLRLLAQELGLALTCIGSIAAGTGLVVRDERGAP